MFDQSFQNAERVTFTALFFLLFLFTVLNVMHILPEMIKFKCKVSRCSTLIVTNQFNFVLPLISVLPVQKHLQCCQITIASRGVYWSIAMFIS